MKVLFLLTQDLESPSGLGRYLPLSKELVKAGHEVQIAALHSDYQNLTNKHQIISGVSVFYVAPMHVKKQGDIKSYYSAIQLFSISVHSTWELTKFALQTTADIIHIAKPHPMNSIAGILAKYLRGKRLFLDCDDYEAASNRFQNRWQHSIITFFEKQIPKHAEITTTNTHFMVQKLLSWDIPNDKIVYLPNGIDPERYPHPDASKIRHLRNKLNLTNKLVISYIGSISFPSHPVDLLVQAFQIIVEQIPDTILMIVGGGEDLADLKQLASELKLQEKTHFIGRVPPEDVHLYYHISNVTVDPVHDDDAARGRAPLKLLESWICEIPFVTSKVGDREVIVRESNAGFLAKPGDANSLAKEILKIITIPQDPEILIRYHSKNISHYYWHKLSERLENIYQK